MINTLLSSVLNENLISLVMSNPRQKSTEVKKIKIRPIMLNTELKFQLETFRSNQIFHDNMAKKSTYDYLLLIINNNYYKQLNIITTTYDYQVLFNKKGKPHITKKAVQNKPLELNHNRIKEYILKEGQPIDFLVYLGIMTKEGKIINQKYDKFKQINRFVEMVDDVMDQLANLDTINIIDFGCGKSYLTFALYYYLVKIKEKSVKITGLDLKEDVINTCNALAKELHYNNLSFQIGNIHEYTKESSIDMVVTLHACDTATDMALKKAVNWGAKVILSVPCCQHELNSQISCDPLKDILKYGIIKERVSALFTDAMRANWLECMGYNVQILEFIDITHTPKNLLIRATKSEAPNLNNDHCFNKLSSLEDYFNASLYINRD